MPVTLLPYTTFFIYLYLPAGLSIYLPVFTCYRHLPLTCSLAQIFPPINLFFPSLNNLPKTRKGGKNSSRLDVLFLLFFSLARTPQLRHDPLPPHLPTCWPPPVPISPSPACLCYLYLSTFLSIPPSIYPFFFLSSALHSAFLPY